MLYGLDAMAHGAIPAMPGGLASWSLACPILYVNSLRA